MSSEGGAATNSYADILYPDNHFDYGVPLILRTSNSHFEAMAADVNTVESCTSSQESVVNRRKGTKRGGALTSVGSSKAKKNSTSIYRKNKALKQMNDVADNESCSSSALLAEALDDLAIA